MIGERSKTAMALASASARKRRVPSGESTSALGVVPSAGPAGGGLRRRVTMRPERVSSTTALSVLALATKRRVPAALSTSADG